MVSIAKAAEPSSSGITAAATTNTFPRSLETRSLSQLNALIVNFLIGAKRS
jgi:hypothetical protein